MTESTYPLRPTTATSGLAYYLRVLRVIGAIDFKARYTDAALPYVDDFLPARNLRNLEDLATHLNRLPETRPVR